jgi:hypothetical protein
MELPVYGGLGGSQTGSWHVRIRCLCDTASVCAVPPELYLVFWFAVAIGIRQSLYCYSRRLLCRREND